MLNWSVTCGELWCFSIIWITCRNLDLNTVCLEVTCTFSCRVFIFLKKNSCLCLMSFINQPEVSCLFFAQGFFSYCITHTIWVGNNFFSTFALISQLAMVSIIVSLVTCPCFSCGCSIATERNVYDTGVINNMLQFLKAVIMWHDFV